MAKILYGVAGEGSGHSSRAAEIINYLLKKGHQVKVISYDRGYKNLSPLFDVTEIFGLHFAYRDNQVKFFKTISQNFVKLPEAKESLDKVLKMIDEFQPDIIFSDFEPISCIAANIKKIPLISIDNQHRLTNMEAEYPKKYIKDAFLAKTVTNLIIFNARACLVISFFKGKITHKGTFLFPPILRQEIFKLKTAEKDYILVYLTSPFEKLAAILKDINKKFIVYGFNEDRQDGNVEYKKASRAGFMKDLADCEGIIANAGFTLMTEALYLHKPYLALPVKGQFEQVFNAYYLEKLGYGKYYDDLNKEKIEKYLANLDKYKKNLKKYKKEDNSKIFQKIDELVKKYSRES